MVGGNVWIGIRDMVVDDQNPAGTKQLDLPPQESSRVEGVMEHVARERGIKWTERRREMGRIPRLEER